jgi:hypothetical protein
MKHCPITGVSLSKVVNMNTQAWEKAKHLPTEAENEWYIRKEDILFIKPKPKAQNWPEIKKMNQVPYAEFKVVDTVHRQVILPAVQEEKYKSSLDYLQ